MLVTIEALRLKGGNFPEMKYHFILRPFLGTAGGDTACKAEFAGHIAGLSILLHLRCHMTKTVKTFKYQFSDLLVTGFFDLCVIILRGLPLRGLILISKIMGSLTFYSIKKYRERVIGNLSIAFGREKDLKEIKKLAKEVFFHFTLTPLETVYAVANGLPLDRFILKIRIEGREHLDAALAQGKGVIALGAHFGSFTLLGTRLAVEGYPFNLVVKIGHFQKLWGRLAFYQGIVGQKLFSLKPATASIKKSLNCLRRNEILYIVADEQQRRGGLPVPFFGQIAYTPPGPAIFSLKTGAPILPMFVLREDEYKRTLVIGNRVEIERTSDEKKDIETLTAKFTKAIEEMVRQYPNQWAWLNRRWKLPREASLPRGGASRQ
jgi:KDO2-lipid IV(A) lauroyltransferase